MVVLSQLQQDAFVSHFSQKVVFENMFHSLTKCRPFPPVDQLATAQRVQQVKHFLLTAGCIFHIL